MSKIPCSYTVAILRTDNGPMLVAAVPDGDDIEAAIREEEENACVTFDREEMRIVEGCVLTDEIKAGDEVIYAGNRYGFLTDKEGRRYSAAVHRRPSTA
jgi:uncharacterized protein (DUF1697 family)